MNKCFQKVPSKEPPLDSYIQSEAFVFLGSCQAELFLPISVFRFHRFEEVIP